MHCNNSERNGVIKKWVDTFFDETDDMVFIKNKDLVYVAGSKPFADLLGIESTDCVIGRTDFDLFSDKDLAKRYTEDDRRMMKRRQPLEEYVEPLPYKNGKASWGLTRKSLIFDEDGEIIGLYGVSRDITEKVELKQSKSELENENRKIRSAMNKFKVASETDMLTKLLNHGTTLSRMKAFLGGEGKNGQHALILIDIDNFKAANDQFGHQRGDQVIARLAEMIVSTFRTSDIVGRVGGDEFLVLMKNVGSMKTVRAKAAELVATSKLVLEKSGVYLNVSASAGVGICMGGEPGFEELFYEADAALQSAKSLGKNRYFIWDDGSSGEAAPEQVQPLPETDDTGALAINQWRSILVADGDAETRLKLKKVLGRSYFVDDVADGSTVLEQLKSGRFAMLIVGTELAEATSWDILEAMRSDSTLKEIPAIVTIDGGDTESEVRALNLGAADVIARPFVPVTLISRVSNAIMRREVRLMEEKNRLYEIRISQQEKLLRMAELDEVTGLLNRRAFVRKAGEMIKSRPAGEFVISCLNINGFKMINDRFGHEEGDRLLKYIADSVLRKLLGDDILSCRDDADVFIALMPNDGERIDKVEHMVPKQLAAYDLPSRITVSIGRYIVNETDVDVNLMIDRAKIAQSTVKGNTRRFTAWYSDEMREGMLREKLLTDQMQASLEKQFFEVLFEPQIDVKTGKPVCAKAAVRWNHPQLGAIKSAEFMPLFEKNGFACELNRYVIRRCCECMEMWKKGRAKMGIVPVAVSLSAADAYEDGTVDQLIKTLKEHGLNPQDLRVEISESSCEDGARRLVGMVERLHKSGFSVGIEKFGSGYSSLVTLKNLSADYIKLDAGFLTNDFSDSVGIGMIEAVVKMAHGINCTVIADSVKTKNNVECLAAIGCDVVQGEFLSGELTPDDFRSKFLTKK